VGVCGSSGWNDIWGNNTSQGRHNQNIIMTRRKAEKWDRKRPKLKSWEHQATNGERERLNREEWAPGSAGKKRGRNKNERDKRKNLLAKRRENGGKNHS